MIQHSEVTMNKQTAVDRYRLESQKLMIKAIRKEISNEEWRLLENKLGEEAKQMERENKIEFAKKCLDKALDLDIRTAHSKVEEYYNETYGDKK